jgi:hypothetical protein
MAAGILAAALVFGVFGWLFVRRRARWKQVSIKAMQAAVRRSNRSVYELEGSKVPGAPDVVEMHSEALTSELACQRFSKAKSEQDQRFSKAKSEKERCSRYGWW